MNGRYWESKRAEARRKLGDLEIRMAIQDPDLFKRLYERLNDRAYPVDPEADGHFGKEDLRIMRGLLGGEKLKDDSGKTVKKKARPW